MDDAVNLQFVEVVTDVDRELVAIFRGEGRDTVLQCNCFVVRYTTPSFLGVSDYIIRLVRRDTVSSPQ